MHYSDRMTVRRILKGDRAAGERLVVENYPRIFRLMLHLCGHKEAAEDLTQQTFVKAWNSLSDFRADSRFSTWLHGIAYHEYSHWRRDQRPETSLDLAQELPDPAVGERLVTISVRRALAHLSSDHREVFVLFHLQDLSVREIAALLEIPPGTVKSRLSWARARIRELLTEPGDRQNCVAAALPIVQEKITDVAITNQLEAR
ncbi:MAG TPA: RNA polymerase sigma factor [Chthonomonadales bacterium]|nr:RNA polymerase sigma factor [Chthonomonadales bacterium]